LVPPGAQGASRNHWHGVELRPRVGMSAACPPETTAAATGTPAVQIADTRLYRQRSRWDNGSATAQDRMALTAPQNHLPQMKAVGSRRPDGEEMKR